MWRLQSLAKWKALLTTSEKRHEWGEWERETEKLSVTVEQLLLGKHIEPSGRHIHQHTECQSAAPAGSDASVPRYCYCGEVGRGEWQGGIWKADLDQSPQHLAEQMFLCMVWVVFTSISPALIDRPRLLMMSLSNMRCNCLDPGCAKINGRQNLDQLISLPLLNC